MKDGKNKKTTHECSGYEHVCPNYPPEVQDEMLRMWNGVDFSGFKCPNCSNYMPMEYRYRLCDDCEAALEWAERSHP